MCFEYSYDTDNNISLLYTAGATIWSWNAATGELTSKSILVSCRWHMIAYPLMFSTYTVNVPQPGLFVQDSHQNVLDITTDQTQKPQSVVSQYILISLIYVSLARTEIVFGLRLSAGLSIMWRTQWTRPFIFFAPNLFPPLILLSEWGDHFTYVSPPTLLTFFASLPF